jgi:hypothetical protein
MYWVCLRYLQRVQRPHPNLDHQMSIYVSVSGLVVELSVVP